MNVWQNEFPGRPPAGHAPLNGVQGELVMVSVAADSRDLESLLEALARVSFPINPQLYHPREAGAETVVEFPAYSSGLAEVRRVLEARGFLDRQVRVTPMMDAILTH